MINSINRKFYPKTAELENLGVAGKVNPDLLQKAMSCVLEYEHGSVDLEGYTLDQYCAVITDFLLYEFNSKEKE